MVCWLFSTNPLLDSVQSHFDFLCDSVPSTCLILSEPQLCYNDETGIDGLVQERRNSSVLAMELHLSCTNPSDYDTSWDKMSPATFRTHFLSTGPKLFQNKVAGGGCFGMECKTWLLCIVMSTGRPYLASCNDVYL